MTPPLTQHEITPENVLSQQHLDWLRHPVTIQMLKNLENYEKHIIGKISSQAFDVTNNSPETIRLFATALSTTRSIKKISMATEVFIEVAQNNIK